MTKFRATLLPKTATVLQKTGNIIVKSGNNVEALSKELNCTINLSEIVKPFLAKKSECSFDIVDRA